MQYKKYANITLLFNIFCSRAILFFLCFIKFFAVSNAVLANNTYNRNQFFCHDQEKYYEIILEQAKYGNPQAISDLPECFWQNRDLIFKAIMIDPNYFKDASDLLRQDKIFITRLIKMQPQVLKYAAPQVRSDTKFLENAVLISRDILQYASWKLLDNPDFMLKMISIDADNYQYASDRLKSMPNLAKEAFADNGLLLKFAPKDIRSNQELVKIAIASSKDAIAFASPELQQNIAITSIKNSEQNLNKLDKFLLDNYLVDANNRNLGKIFGNKGKFSAKNQLIDYNFVTKWHIKLRYKKSDAGILQENWQLIPVYNRNYQQSWQDDFKKYPDLVKKIESFFAKRKINKKIVDNLKTTFFWKVKNNPETVAFNIYNMQQASEHILDSQFANVTSLTAIAQKIEKKWVLSVAEVIFNKDICLETNFTAGHKTYQVFDLIEYDKDTMVVFKIEDSLNDHLEVYSQQQNGKYRFLYATQPFPDWQ